MRTLDLAAPYAFAILLYLIGPLLTGLVQLSVSSVINQGRANDPNVNWQEVPDYLMPTTIGQYVEYATDAAQVIPALLLPIVGAVYGFSSGIPAPVGVTFLIIAFIAAIGMLAWLTRALPAVYVSHKRFGYSILSIAGIALNLIGMSLALAFG
jgi:hypothetical protein